MSRLYFALAITTGTLIHYALTTVPAAYDCDDDKPVVKYYGDSCTDDSDCFGQPPMQCKHGKCTCRESFVPADRFVGEAAVQKVCIKAPTLNALCSTTCQKPYVCEEHATLNTKICQCVSPFMSTNGYCHLGCKGNETYSSTKFLCIRACEAHEIKIDDVCLTLSKVNESCSVTKQCLPAYSECKNGTCQCKDGFAVDQDGNCNPQEVVCPNNQVMKSPRRCTVSNDPQFSGDITSLTHICSENEFCYTYAENAAGFCCPKVEPGCPVGKPHPTAVCDFFSSEQCPYTTHECITPHVGASALCCPQPCDTAKVNINGKCYPTVSLNDRCFNSKQCYTMNSACVDGVCKCVGKAAEDKQTSRSSCSIRCSSNEIKYQNQCYEPLSLGDSCANETWRCGPNSICNKFKVCSCKCPQFTLAKDVCAPLPQCPAPRRFPGRGFAMELVTETKTYYDPITAENRRELLQNVTFCSISRKKAPDVDYVRKCPAGQYCARYISNLGLCCKIPEYLCPNGQKPTSVKQCSTRNTLSCGVGQYCHDFLQTANPRDSEGKICCNSEDV